jgi:hypothetical protein
MLLLQPLSLLLPFTGLWLLGASRRRISRRLQVLCVQVAAAQRCRRHGW